MKKFIDILLIPTGLWVLYAVCYISDKVNSNNEWWDFPFFMTLFIAVAGGIVISLLSSINVTKNIESPHKWLWGATAVLVVLLASFLGGNYYIDSNKVYEQATPSSNVSKYKRSVYHKRNIR